MERNISAETQRLIAEHKKKLAFLAQLIKGDVDPVEACETRVTTKRAAELLNEILQNAKNDGLTVKELNPELENVNIIMRDKTRSSVEKVSLGCLSPDGIDPAYPPLGMYVRFDPPPENHGISRGDD